MSGVVTQNPTTVGTLFLMMMGWIAISNHFGKVAAYVGAGLYLSAVVLALYSVTANSGPTKLLDIVVVVVCIASAAWAGRNYALYHDRTSNGLISQTD